MTDSNKQSHLGTKPEERFDLDVAEKEGYQRRGGDPQNMPSFDENVSRQSENVRNMGENVRTGVEQMPSKGRGGGKMAEEQPLGEELEGEAVHRTAEKSSQVRLSGDVADERGADLLRTGGVSGNVPSSNEKPSELEKNQGERNRNKNLSSSSSGKEDENLNRRGDFSASSQQGVGNIAVDIGDQPNASSGSNMQQQQQQQQQQRQQPNVSAGARGNENLQQLGNREQQNLSGRGNTGVQQENRGGRDREQGVGDRNRFSGGNIGQEQDISDRGNLGNLGSGQQMQQDRQQQNLQPEQRYRQVQQESRERGFDQQQQQQQQNVVEPERFGNVSLVSSGGGVSSMQEGQQLQQPQQQQQQRYDTGEPQHEQHRRGFNQRHHVDRSLQHIYDELRTVFSETETIDTKNVKLEKVTELQDRLRKIDEQYVDGKFRNDKGEIPEGQAELSEMLNSVHEKLQDLVLSTGTGVGEESEDVTSLQMR